jgi:hypothetical protein
MQRLLAGLISLAMMIGSVIAGAQGDTTTAELLKQARAAIGGEKSLAKVQGLSCNGTVQRAMGDRTVTGEVAIHLQLPDKMLRSDSISPMGDAVIVTEQGINGDTLLRNSKVLNAPPGMMIRTPPSPDRGSDAETQGLRASRAELARFAAVLLLASTPAMPVEFSYGGEAESPDGKADVLDLKGPGTFAAKIFLDKASHRPLLLAYRGVSPRVVMQTQRAGGPGPGPQRGGPPPDASHVPPTPPTPDVVDITMFLDDYKSVDGVMLPHHMTRSVGGETTEDVTCKSIKVNPAFKTEFAGK